VAERLFAEQGRYGPSLREIGIAAGSANRNVVQYHFGDREGLIHAIFARRLPEMEAHRARMLAALPGNPADADLRQLIEILFRPIAECKDEDGRRSFAGFLRKNSIYRREPRIGTNRDLAPVTTLVTNLIKVALHDVRSDLIGQRLHTCTLMFLDAFIDVDEGTSIFSEAEAMDEVLTLSVAILRAPDHAAGAERTAPPAAAS